MLKIMDKGRLIRGPASLRSLALIKSGPGLDEFLPACTYVQRGSTICFVVVLLVLLVVLADTLIRILHYCPISPCFQHIIAPLHTALRALARQPCACLPGSLARACPAALHAHARQPCARCCPDKSEQVQQNLRALLSRHVRTGSDLQYGNMDLPGSLAR
jgi:hypothetical protein